MKELRRQKDWAQEKLGLEAEVDRILGSKIEREIANPSLEIQIKPACQLDVTVAKLLSRDFITKVIALNF